MPVTGQRAQFRRMQDGTAADYAIIEAAEQAYFAKLPDRILDTVAVSARIAWIIEHHPVFQTYHYGPYLGVDKNARERYRGHQWFDDTAEFCARYDENCFDRDYEALPLEHFVPLVHEVFGRTPVFPETAGLPG